MPRRVKSTIGKLMDKERWVTFGMWVAEKRAGVPHHFTQERAAKEIGISRPHLSQIENGKVSVPRETVKKIARALNCPKEIAFARAGYKVKSVTLDEKAYLTRILR